MIPAPATPTARRRGFTLVEVILAVGVIGIAIASLIGILASSFQQVDDIMQTNRALTAAQGLVTALDNPRSILRDLPVASGLSRNDAATNYLPSATIGGVAIDNAAGDGPNFDLVYNLLRSGNPVWAYVYERRQVIAANEVTSTGGYNLNANPALVEVVIMAGSNDAFSPALGAARNVVGAPMRVRLTLSRLLVNQRVTLDTATGEPSTAVYTSGALPAPPSGGYGADGYALAYLPIVAEFFPHEYEDPTVFKAATFERQPVLVQTIVINR